MVYKFKINYRSLGGSSNESTPEQDQQSVPDNTNQENQENQDNTNQENQIIPDIYTSWADQYNEDELIEEEKNSIDLYRRQFVRILQDKYYISDDDRNKILETGIIPEKYQEEFEDNYDFFISPLRQDFQYPRRVRQKYNISDEAVSSKSTVKKYKAPQPKYEAVSSKSTSSIANDEAVSSKSTVKKYKAPQPNDEAVSSKSTSSIANDEAVSSMSTSSTANDKKSDQDSKKSRQLEKLLIQYHTMKLGDLRDEDIDILTDRLTENLNSDYIDRIRNDCFIREQNLIAKRDKFLNVKYQNFNDRSNNYLPFLWRDPDLVRYINNYTHNYPDKPSIIFREQVNIVNDSNTKGTIKKQASNLATLAMRNAINNYYEDILNRLREECEEKIRRLMNPISEEEFPTLNKAFEKKT